VIEQVILGDCLEEMKKIPDNSIDMILTDPPYGTIACKWDSIIPFEPMWEQINRITKQNSAILLFGNEPFTAKLICSNLSGFKYRIDWDKHIPSGMTYAKYRPMQQSEDICVFEKMGLKTKYYPQMIKRDKPIKSGGNKIKTRTLDIQFKDEVYDKIYEYKNPTTLIKFTKIRKGALHPTQKPIDLLEYLIKTYTKENDLVLDFTCGSGSTLVAAKNLKRQFIGIEKEKEYYETTLNRLYP